MSFAPDAHSGVPRAAWPPVRRPETHTGGLVARGTPPRTTSHDDPPRSPRPAAAVAGHRGLTPPARWPRARRRGRPDEGVHRRQEADRRAARPAEDPRRLLPVRRPEDEGGVGGAAEGATRAVAGRQRALADAAAAAAQPGRARQERGGR